ncbi:sister chromatid cohesion 1 protein 3 [Mercurialis annua]|uniref:sister chromatid cohesion 1 protein 3 n=1 Tax=Mercurialis annua TaxID=3986 RepID=UPI002160E05B|nr:sister chromatid cohesion 1 protein 3 [Mercurialis annua]
MFYSQTFLARKGPLGTVWCAAHLQSRLKKSHYTSTDIPSTVDRIMCPEVPIALRMSGHLLLGVVRIYSKKVDYLYHDCNIVLVGLRKAFASIEVNLPENATTAKFESVTLPQTFDLDALDVDFDVYADGSLDNHLRDQEEITLPDQIPTDRNPYVVITFDEDIMMDMLPPEKELNTGVRLMEEDVIPPSGVDFDMDSLTTIPSNVREGSVEAANLRDPGPSSSTGVPMEIVAIQESGPSNQTELHTEILDIQGPGLSNQTEVLNSAVNDETSPPEFEALRDNVDAFSSENFPLLFTNHQHDASESSRSLNRGLSEKQVPSPIEEDVLPSGGQSLPFQQCPESPTSASQNAPESFDTRVSFGHVLPELALNPTPAVQQPRQRPRRRKRFDKTTVLSNRVIKKALEDHEDIKRRRLNKPSNALDIWKSSNILRKEQVFFESALTGSCADLSNCYRNDYISSKPHLVLERDVTPEPMTATYPPTEVVSDSRDATSPARSTEVILEPISATSPAPVTEMFSERREATSPVPAIENLPDPFLTQPCVPEVEADPAIENLRQHEGHTENTLLPEFLPTPFRSDDFTPISAKTLGSDTQNGASMGTEALPTPDIAASTATYTTDLETPRTFLEEQFDAGYSGLPDIPESVKTGETGDLYFLELDNSPPASQGTQGSQGIDSLSVRTRAVAQYLKKYSPMTPESEDVSGDLSLNKILEGKTRKVCARMFSETLVLKSYGLIDVQQEEPYSDITLKLTSRLSKAEI